MPSTANSPAYRRRPLALLSRLWTTLAREATLAANAQRQGVHQLSHATRMDRYPALFRELATACEVATPRILSFGCSSGEECMTLRKYFPAASIVGADISEAILEQARRNYQEHGGIQFCLSSQETLRRHGPFDIVCCFSVLCRHRATRRRRNCCRVYPFEQFQTQCRDLAELVLPGGLLAVYNSNFRFTDTDVASQFQVIAGSELTESGFVIKFDRSNKRLSAQNYPHCIFRKL